MVVKEFIKGSDNEYIGSGTLRDALVELWKQPEKGIFISVPSNDSQGCSLRKKCENRPYWAKLYYEHVDDANDKVKSVELRIVLPNITQSFKVWYKCPFKGFVDMIISALTQDKEMFRYIKQHDTVLVTNVESPDKLSQLTTDDLDEHNSLQDASEFLKNVCNCIYVTSDDGINGMSFDVTELDDEAIDHIMNIMKLVKAISVSLVSDVEHGEIRSRIALKWTDTDEACSQLHSIVLK